MAEHYAVALTGTSIWRDPPASAPVAPTRLNADPQYPPFAWTVAAGGTVTFEAVLEPGAVAGPPDGSLGGRLFVVDWIEWSGSAPAMIAPVAGFSSKVVVTFLSSHIGHHVLGFSRKTADGLAQPVFAVPIDVQ